MDMTTSGGASADVLEMLRTALELLDRQAQFVVAAHLSNVIDMLEATLKL
jgi:hypothetical protein